MDLSSNEPLLQGQSHELANPKKPSFGTHFKVLLRKQYLTQIRNKKSLFCLALSPFLLCLILYLIQLTVSMGLRYEEPNPPVSTAGNFQACKPHKGFSSCISIGYGIFVSISLFFL